MIVIIARLKMNPEKIDNYLQVSRTYATDCRQLPGVLSVTSTQVLDEDNTFLFVQEYENEDAVSNHDKSDVFHQFMEAIGILMIDTPSVHRYTVSEKSKIM